MSLHSFKMPMALWAQMARMGIESQTVIAMRTAAMMGILPQAPGENARMFQEKSDAANEAVWAAVKAVGRGAQPERVMSAALRPYRRRTKAHAKRLTNGLTK